MKADDETLIDLLTRLDAIIPATNQRGVDTDVRTLLSLCFSSWRICETTRDAIACVCDELISRWENQIQADRDEDAYWSSVHDAEVTS